MTFSEQIKQEILDADLPKNECCRRAFAYGLLACADLTEDGSVDLRAANADQADRIASILGARMACEVTKTEIVGEASSHMLLHVTFRKQTEWLNRFFDEQLEKQREWLFPCPQCPIQFMRGVFVSKGTISDPTKGVHLEISCGSDTVARHISHMLTDLGVPPKIVLRANGQHVYYKSSAAVEEFLTLLNTNRALFTAINAKIERELRNHINRASNCELGNIQKAVAASAKQIAAIAKLRESDRWDSLSPSLRHTAELRLQYPDAGLNELALLHQPVLTKSGLNHRLKKLTEYSAELDFKDNK